jgi:hypothetical protein
MKILYSLFLLIYLSFLTPLPVSAQATTLSQDLSGVWQGKLSQEVGGLYREYDFKLELKQMGNVIQGISRISADGYSANMSLEGTLNGNFVEFKEIKIIDQKIRKNAFWCLKKGLLMLSLQNGYEYLQGNWQGWSKEGSCTPGKLWVSRPQPFNVEKERPPIAQDKDILKESSQEPSEISEEYEDSRSTIIPTSINLDKTFQGRVIREEQAPVFIKKAEITLEIWDHKEIDGDVISLYLNEELILEEYTLQGTRHRITITIDTSKDNYLMLYAHNLGEITPNTAAISIDDGIEKQIRILRSDFDQSEMILLQYKAP